MRKLQCLYDVVRSSPATGIAHSHLPFCCVSFTCVIMPIYHSHLLHHLSCGSIAQPKTAVVSRVQFTWYMVKSWLREQCYFYCGICCHEMWPDRWTQLSGHAVYLWCIYIYLHTDMHIASISNSFQCTSVSLLTIGMLNCTHTKLYLQNAKIRPRNNLILWQLGARCGEEERSLFGLN